MDQISSAVLSANLIHIPQTAETDLIKLAQGNLIRATVQRVADEMALLNIGGKVFSVRTEIPLEAQQRVLLQVTNADPSRITFQVIHQSAPAEAGATATPTIPQNNLQLMLTNWGLEPDQLNQTIAKSLFAHSQTLTPDAVSEMRTMWHTLPALASLPPDSGGNAGNIEALAYLHTNQIPITKDSLLLARTWLNHSLPIAESLSTLQQNLQSVQTQVQALLKGLQNQPQPQLPPGTTQPQPQAAQTQLLTNLLSTLNTTISRTASWSITAATPAEQIISRLANLITNLGTPPEANLAQHLTTATPTTPPTPTPHPITPPPHGLDGGGERGPSPIPQTNPGQPAPATGHLQPAPAPGESTIAQTSGTHQSATIAAVKPDLPPLQQLASAVNEALAHPEHLNQNTTHTLQQLSGHLETLTRDLGAIQLSNLTAPPNPVTEPYYLFPIPMQNSNGTHITAQLRVYRRNGGVEVDPKNMRLALLLDLPDLGEMAIEVNLFERHINGNILSGQARTHKLVQSELGDLRQSLSSLGYHVDGFAAKMLPANELSIFEEREPVERMAVPMPQINLTA